MTPPSAGANLPSVRSHNEALVLDLLRAATTGSGDGASRVELARRTGLTPQAVSKIVGRLRDEGLVDEAGRGMSTGGKPRTLLRLVRGARLAVGVHMDRNELTVLLADLTGEAVGCESVPFDFGGDREAVLEAVAGRVRATVAEAGGRVLGVGVACPGPLDHEAGVLGRITHLPAWEGFPLRDVLAERLGLPVVLDKDTNAAVLTVMGEGGAGGERGRDRVYLHLGTGLGAGLVLGGDLYRGSHSGAGEFGHQTVQLDGPRCDCGSRGCLEALCLAALERGDTARAAHLVGVGAANLMRLLDLDLVVLGGREVLAAPDRYTAEVSAVLAARVPPATAEAAPIPVRVAEEGARAVALGAAQLVLGPLFRCGTFTSTAVPARSGVHGLAPLHAGDAALAVNRGTSPGPRGTRRRHPHYPETRGPADRRT